MADAETVDHSRLERGMPFLLWPVFLLLAGALAHLIAPSFRLGPWVWRGSTIAVLGKAVIVALPLGVAAFGTANLLFKRSFFKRG